MQKTGRQATEKKGEDDVFLFFILWEGSVYNRIVCCHNAVFYRVWELLFISIWGT